MRINQNTLATNAYRNLSTNNMSLGKSLEKLSSGFRINRAADDASGLVISQNLRAQIGGMRQATRNAQDGISVVQTAEGALGEVQNILGRMRDLSVQAANTGTNDADARNAAQAEIVQLSAEVDRIASQTAFGKQNLLDGSFGGVEPTETIAAAITPPTGTPATGNVTIDGTSYALDFSGAVDDDAPTAAETGAAVAAAVNDAGVEGLTATSDAAGIVTYTNSTDAEIVITDLGAANAAAAAVDPANVKTFQIGANSGQTVTVGIEAVSSAGLGIGSLDVATDAADALTRIDAAIGQVSSQRGDLGAVQNRFESMINNLQVTTENLVASESRIRDTDMAAEMTNFTKSQILTQASTAMLAQANQVPQSVLSLLR